MSAIGPSRATRYDGGQRLFQAAGASYRSQAAIEIPRCKPGDLRVVSYNILCSSPLYRPEPFSRLFAALSPDVLLLQEWEDADAQETAAWFTRWVSDEHAWHVRQSAGRGVAVVSRHPLERFGPYRLPCPTDSDGYVPPSRYFGEHVGFVGATLPVRAGKLTVASVHLTCCGSSGSIEDRRRGLEAEAINQVLQERSTAAAVLGGDLNLIGSRTPLENLARGLDADGENLEIVSPLILGHQQRYTWRDSRTPHPPGRLDWMCYTASPLRLSNAFVLDTARLAPEALSASGCHAQDTSHSDHLPLVLDLHLPHAK